MHGVYLNSNPSEMTPKLLWLLLNISYVILNLKKSNCFEENKSECVRALLRPVLKLKIFYDLFSLTYRDSLRLSFMLDWVQSVAVYQLHMIAWWEKYVLCVSFTDQHRKLHEHLRLTEWNETIPLWLYYIHTQRYKDKRKHTYRTLCTGAPWGNIHTVSIWLSQTWDQQYSVHYAVFALWMQDGGICHWTSVCGHLSDARRNEGWFFPKLPIECKVITDHARSN